ncbi:MAG TPA: peptide ABC transporter substrate-binding protein [Candidatus Baltobacteraceae bacterium]|jgi:peptide/nickel transport system substrate-binding protein|nr:peptide ABC transporter substrate-binding protein [Candidatus Baltobacteraceae bacterium]
MKLLRLAVALTAVFLAVGCSKAGQTSGPSNELRVVLNINPTQLNPILEQNTIEEFVDGLMFDLLVSQDAQHHDIPDLATIVPTSENGGISKDGLTITYRLRHGVKWHDGAPFTSKDVKFTWQAIMNPANNVLSRRGYDQVARVDTPDDYTVVFHMKKIFAPAIDTIFGESDTPYYILPAHLLAKYPNLNQVPFNSAPIGTGAYRFARWERGDRIVLTANPEYFKGAPKIKQLILPIILDDNTEVAQLRSHEADVGIEIPSTAYRDLQGAPSVVRQLVDAPYFSAIEFNTSRAPLDDVRVRRALVMGLDRFGITRDDSYGTAIVATADLSPFYWAFDKGLRPAPYDPAAARALLDAAGWRAGADGIRSRDGRRLSLQLVYGQGSSLSRVVGTQLQQMYKAIGVDVSIKTYDYATLYAATETGGILNGGKFDLALYPWISGADPDNSSQWMCSAIPPAGNNISRYCSPEMDAAQRLALSTFDRATRAKAYATIEALLLRDAPAAFLYYRRTPYAHDPDLQNFTPNGITEGWNAYEWNR